MTSRDSRPHDPARSLCADLHPDDGPATRRRKEDPYDGSDDRKTRQLCAQVRRALHGLLPVPADPFFEGLHVEAVEPDPDAGRLRVVISVHADAQRSPQDVKTRLVQMSGFLRSQVAMEIHRKRAPLLTFELIPPQEPRP